MDYQGSKSRLAKYIQPLINLCLDEEHIKTYYEPFVGRKGTNSKYEKWFTAGIGYFASYGGRFFDGGYGRDSKGGRSIYRERLANAREQAHSLHDIMFDVKSWEDYDMPTDKIGKTFFYLDPPYRGTKGYSGASAMNWEKFYDWCEKLGKYCYVLISEYSMPCERFTCVWEKERKILQKSDRTTADTAVERLYTPKGGLYDYWFKVRTNEKA